jgi:hypothetical protein
MNCLDFRRLVLVDPRHLEEDAKAHAEQCLACREVLERQRESDDRLFAALQVPAPDGLAERILVSRGVEPGRRRWVWAIAASVLLTGGVVASWRIFLGSDPLGAEAIQHVAGEPQSFTTVHAVDAGFLNAALAENGLKMVAALGQVSYARFCPFDGRTARHIVVQTAGGPVTLFLLPEGQRKHRRTVTETGGMTAVTMPAARGTIAIVAASHDQAMAFERAIRNI